MALIRKVSKFAENIEELEKNIGNLKNNSNEIIDEWIHSPKVSDILKYFNIDLNDFRKNML